MAMTGGAAYLVKSERTNYGSNSWTTDLYIYVKVISQNVVANTSTIALGMYVYIEENHGGSQNAAVADDLCVDDVSDADQLKN